MDYDLKFRNSSSHANADALSRHPMEETSLNVIDPVEAFYIIQVEKLPISSFQVRLDTRNDRVLSKVLVLILDGWAYTGDTETGPF